jgi:retinol dehydrogenase-12
VTLNPGNLSSELQRHGGMVWQFAKLMFYPPVNGAYTELFAGLAPEAAVLKGNEWGKLVYLDNLFVGVLLTGTQ